MVVLARRWRALALGAALGLVLALGILASDAQQGQTGGASSLPAPTNVVVSVVSGGIRIAWDAPTGLPSGWTLNRRVIDRKSSADDNWQNLLTADAQRDRSYLDQKGDIGGRFLAGRGYGYRVAAGYFRDLPTHREFATSDSESDSATAPTYASPASLKRADHPTAGNALSWSAPQPAWGSSAPAHSGYELRIIHWVASREHETIEVTLAASATSYTDTRSLNVGSLYRIVPMSSGQG